MNRYFQNKWVVSLIAGILLGLSFPPVNLSFLTIPAFILIFHLASLCDSNRQFAYVAYPGLVFWNVITTYWLTMASVPAGIAAILANAAVMTLPLMLMRYFQQKYSGFILLVVLQASAWTTYEFLHHNWDLAWPWLAIGNAWAKQISLIQYISITGHLGITFWVTITAALAYQVIKTGNKNFAVGATAILLALPLASLLFFAMDKPVESDATLIPVTVIQPNHDSYLEYGGMSGNDEVIDSLFSITVRTKTPETKLIVWPENAIENAVLMNSRHLKRIADSARVWNTSFIVGTGLYRLYPDEVPELTRGLYGSTPYNIFNGTFFADASGATARYDKHNLVPIVERIPFLPLLTTIDVFNWVDWGGIAGFGKGTEAVQLHTQEFITPGLICYDSVYPSWIRNFVNDGAGFLTIITNDGWWGDSSGHRQHFEYAKLRAIEFNRWVVRSANNGTSGIIRPDGTVEQKTDYWVRTGFNSMIPVITEKTFYAKYGDWLPYQALGISIVFWLIAYFDPKEITTLMK